MSGVYPPGAVVRRSARISPGGRYRYSLARRWEIGTPAQFVMLNPSTADADLDDPTIRRCVGFARSLGCAGLVVVNLYAYRATKPAQLWEAEDPVGPDADHYLRIVAGRALLENAPLIAAWGTNARRDRVAEALDVIGRAGAGHLLTALGTTKDGSPRHPLYLPSIVTPQPWGPA